MAVLKSFELKGNKLSFANWISNLSPTETPFTSMIKKIPIDQTQYSWQTDSLAPATAETFSEGSQATLQPRASTKVFTNFTSIFRRAAAVTDTNEATSAYGRRDEKAYQVGKAGKELLRDTEYNNLSTLSSVPGTSTEASRSAGFKALCAGLYEPDPDTFAITHQGVAVVDPDKPWFALKDIFNVTTNLFLSGSKANKIMFHPKHMNIFSDKIGYNEEEPQIFRMFEGLSEKYNALVTKIKDPVGRQYDLIPNRFMPIGQVYIFNEDDWAQMVLREPRLTPLAKTGSKKTIMAEMEVGLQHKHPFASGVLDLLVVAYKAELVTNKSKLTAFIPDEGTLRVHATDTAGVPQSGVHIKFEKSHSDVVELETLEDITDIDGNLHIWVRPRNPGKVIIHGYNYATDRNLLTNPVTLEVVPPTTKFTLESSKTQILKDQALIVNVTDHLGYPVPVGTEVYLHADEGLNIVRPNSSSVTTDDMGNATFRFNPSKMGKINFRVSFSDEAGAWKTNAYQVNVEDNDIRLKYGPDTQSLLTWKVDGTQSISITATDDGVAIPNAEIKVRSTNPSVVDFTAVEYSTNANGVATTQMLINGKGKAIIYASYLNRNIPWEVTVGSGSLELTIDNPKMEIGDPDGATLTARILKADGSPSSKAGLTVNWSTDPSNMDVSFDEDSSSTNGEGIATTTVKDNVSTCKGKIGAVWLEDGASKEVDFEVIPTHYRIVPNEKEITVTGGLNDQIGISVKLEHDWADVESHTLDFTSKNTNIVNWTSGTGRTDHTGYVNPSNTVIASDFGTAELVIDGDASDTESFTPAIVTLISKKPVISFTTDSAVLLEGDTGEVTITLEDYNGSILTGYQGTVSILTNRDKIEPSVQTISFNGSSRANFSFTAKALGSYEINFALPDGTNLPVKGRNLIEIVQPSLRVTTNPDKYTSGSNVQVLAYLTKPASSTASLFEKEVTFTATPDLPGIGTGVKVKTDINGVARLSTSPINGNSEYTITAAFNGVSATYDLEPEQP